MLHILPAKQLFRSISNSIGKIVALSLMALVLTGCNLLLTDIGKPPALSRISAQIAVPGLAMVRKPNAALAPQRTVMTDNALWNKRDSIYFRDTRAYEIGDILTVSITMNDSAKFDNRSKRDGSISGALGGSGTFTLPSGFNPDASIDASLNGKLGAEKSGTVNRSENIRLQVAAIVVAASANGNLKISGSQEVRVNRELRILTVEGIVRSKDILPNNTIPYEKVAEARISYGGNNTRPRRTSQWLPSQSPTPMPYRREY